jgi:hypothetical protein
MRWVQIKSYAGPDRRKGNRWRLFDRRKRDAAIDLPALQVLLRQLHLRVLDVQTAREALLDFQTRLQVARTRLCEAGETEAASHIRIIETKLARGIAQGRLEDKDAEHMQDSAAAALCALR